MGRMRVAATLPPVESGRLSSARRDLRLLAHGRKERQPSHRWGAGAATLERTRARPAAQPSTVNEESGRAWAWGGSWLKTQRHHDQHDGLQGELMSRSQRAAWTQDEGRAAPGG